MKPYIITSFLLVMLLSSCSDFNPESEVLDEMAHPDPASFSFPDQIFLPNGYAPEGITSGSGTEFFAGSVASGAIYKGSYRTGAGAILIPAEEGKRALGLDYAPGNNQLYVAGGNGEVRIYNATTGAEVTTINLNGQSIPNTFINDVVVTRDAAYLTDSFNPRLFKVNLKQGEVPDTMDVEAIPLGGDYEFTPGPFVFNANGIDATPSGDQLIIAHSTDGKLYTVDPGTGHAELIDLGGTNLPSADGIVLDGKTLYVVQNSLNQISAVKLSPDFTTGEVIGVITNPDFKIPTTAAEFGNSIYAVNARFDEVNPFGGSVPDIEFDVVRVSKIR